MRPPDAVAGRDVDSTLSFSTTWPSCAALDDDGLPHADALLGVELLERGQRLVGIAVILEGDRDHVVAIPSFGQVLDPVVSVMEGILRDEWVSRHHTFLVITTSSARRAAVRDA